MKNYTNLKVRAKNLRRKGFSLKEISEQLKIAKSTASLWSKSIRLNKYATNRLNNNSILGRQKSIEIRNVKNQNRNVANKKCATKVIKSASINIDTIKIFCALLYWGEGSKNDSCLRFTNSDPKMISTFLMLLRKGFPKINEKKLRCVLQIHEYHNESKEIEFWSNITKITPHQFTKSYRKTHTGSITRQGYHGTIGIKYYDKNVVDQIIAIYNTLSDIGV